MIIIDRVMPPDTSRGAKHFNLIRLRSLFLWRPSARSKRNARYDRGQVRQIAKRCGVGTRNCVQRAG